MGKIISLISSGVWPYVILLLIVGGFVWFGVEFSSRGAEIRQASLRLRSVTASKDSLQTALDYARTDIKKAQADRKEDSVNYAKTIAATQKTCFDVKVDRDYWKDYAEKVESGEWCPEFYGLFKKKKRLVRCVPHSGEQ
jgi:hypothetical protein